MTPSEFLIRNVALMAVGKSEIVLARLCHAVELVFRYVFRQPISLIFSEIELLGDGVPVHPEDLADTVRNDLQAATVQIETINLRVPLGWHADVARRADLEIELLVGTDGEILPTVRLVLRQVAEDDGRFRWVVEVVFDLVDFGDLGELCDIERALVQDDAVRAM